MKIALNENALKEAKESLKKLENKYEEIKKELENERAIKSENLKKIRDQQIDVRI